MYILHRDTPVLSTLPEDVLLEISSYLDVEDILTWRAVRLHTCLLDLLGR
jgi:F-box domain